MIAESFSETNITQKYVVGFISSISECLKVKKQKLLFFFERKSFKKAVDHFKTYLPSYICAAMCSLVMEISKP